MRIVRVVGWSVVAVLLAGAVLLTFLRLVQPHGGLWVRGVAFAPFALPAYAVVLLCCLVAARRRPTMAVPALAALLGLGLHAWWVAPYYTASGQPAPGERLTVMTVNVLNGAADAAAVVEVATRADVDLLAVQEIDPATQLAMEEAGLNEHLPHHAGQASYTASATMLFSRHPLGDLRPIETTWDSFAVDVRVGGGEPGSDVPLTVVVVHPHSPFPDDVGWREDHATLRVALGSERPDLVLGDLNATPDHEPFRRLLDTGLRDVAEEAGEGWQLTWPANGSYRLGGLLPTPVLVPIDHVLVGERWHGLASWTAPVPGSDHLALLAEVARGG